MRQHPCEGLKPSQGWVLSSMFAGIKDRRNHSPAFQLLPFGDSFQNLPQLVKRRRFRHFSLQKPERKGRNDSLQKGEVNCYGLGSFTFTKSQRFGKCVSDSQSSLLLILPKRNGRVELTDLIKGRFTKVRQQFTNLVKCQALSNHKMSGNKNRISTR